MTKYTYNKAVRLTAKRAALMEAMKFYAKLLKIDKLDLTICLSFKHGYAELFRAHAQVYYINPRRINIEIDAKVIEYVTLGVVAHEMVHVKQYVTGKLSSDKKDYQLWKGKRVKGGLKYTEEPWEIEAMRAESLMMQKYVEYRDSPKDKK